MFAKSTVRKIRAQDVYMFTTFQIKGAIDIETHLDIFNMQMLKKKSLYKSVSDLTSFSQDLGLFSSGL